MGGGTEVCHRCEHYAKSRCEHADEQEQQTKRQMCKAARGANGCLAGHWRHEENGQSKEKKPTGVGFENRNDIPD